RYGEQLWEELLDDLLLRLVSLMPGLQVHENESVRHLAGSAESQAGGGEEPAPLGKPEQDRLDLAHVSIRVGERRALGREDDSERDSAVLGRNQLAPHEEEGGPGDHDEEKRNPDHPSTMAQRGTKRAIVEPVQPTEEGVEGPRRPGVGSAVERLEHP